MSEFNKSRNLEVASMFAGASTDYLKRAIIAEKNLRHPNTLEQDGVPYLVSTDGLKSQVMYSVAKRLVEQKIQHNKALTAAYRSNEIYDLLQEAKRQEDSVKNKFTLPWRKRKGEVEVCLAHEEVRRLGLLFEFNHQRANFEPDTE